MLLWIAIAAVIWVLKVCWEQALGDIDGRAWRGYLIWMVKGLVGPIFVWLVLGGGLWPGATPIIPGLAGARGRPGFIEAVFQATGPVAFLAATLWSAITAAWLTVIAGQRMRDRTDYRYAVIFWTVVLALPAWGVWKVFGPYGTGMALSLWLVPICWATSVLEPVKVPIPTYSKAVARAKFGRYTEAEAAVIEQLEHHAEDFEGWLLLAELYASKFNDLPEADRTIRQLCTQPGLNPVQISLALNRLADWHLKYGQDPLAARAALTEIIRILPESHPARMAGQRLAQLAKSREDWLEQQQPKPVALPALGDSILPGLVAHEDALSPVAARERAAICVERLRDDPNRIDAREEFARLLAGPLGQPNTAIDQLELLIAMPGQPDRKRAEWIAGIASWQEHKLGSIAAAQLTMHRLIRDFPQTPQAFAAQRKLSLLEMEQRVQARQNKPAPPARRLRVE